MSRHYFPAIEYMIIYPKCHLMTLLADRKPQPYSGEIRLVGGTTVSQGLVHMYLNGQWGRVCSDNITSDEANVMCRQLGYDSAVSYNYQLR